MSRQFGGVSDHAEITIDLSSYPVITLSLWYYVTVGYNDTVHTMLEYGNPNWTIGGFLFLPWGPSGIFIGVGDASGNVWLDSFPNIGHNQWIHGLIVYDRATPTHKFWLNGSPSTRTTVLHNASTYGNFANSVLNCFSRNGGASLFGAGRIAELAIWDGDVSGIAVGSGGSASHSLPNSLASGVQAPLAGPKQPLLYVPWLGYDSPEPDYSGNQHSAVLTGPTYFAHPRATRTLLMPGSLAS